MSDLANGTEFKPTLLGEGSHVGRVYRFAHAIEQPDGSLHGVSAKFPKLFDDPAYCPRLIATLARLQNVSEAEIGKPVVVALVRLDQEG